MYVSTIKPDISPSIKYYYPPQFASKNDNLTALPHTYVRHINPAPVWGPPPVTTLWQAFGARFAFVYAAVSARLIQH